MRLALAALLACHGAPAFEIPVNHSDAELYLSTVGIPKGLPLLDVKIREEDFASGFAWAMKVRGWHTQLSMHHNALQEMPILMLNESLGPCTCILVDPDQPERSEDASIPGSRGVYLNYLVTDVYETNQESGNAIFDYVPPRPAIGYHRMIFVLFKQSAAGCLTEAAISDVRQNFDLKHFIAGNPGLTPAAIAFYYVRPTDKAMPLPVEKPPDPEMPPLEEDEMDEMEHPDPFDPFGMLDGPPRGGPRGGGPRGDGPPPNHDEL